MRASTALRPRGPTDSTPACTTPGTRPRNRTMDSIYRQPDRARVERRAANADRVLRGFETSGDEEAAGSLGLGVPVDQRPEGGVMPGDLKVGQLVDDDVVEHPSWLSGQASRYADASIR